jgi:hypothetical protein
VNAGRILRQRNFCACRALSSPLPLAGEGGSRRRQVYAVCASLTACGNPSAIREGAASPEYADAKTPLPRSLGYRLRSLALPRKRERGSVRGARSDNTNDGGAVVRRPTGWSYATNRSHPIHFVKQPSEIRRGLGRPRGWPSCPFPLAKPRGRSAEWRLEYSVARLAACASPWRRERSALRRSARRWTACGVALLDGSSIGAGRGRHW